LCFNFAYKYIDFNDAKTLKKKIGNFHSLLKCKRICLSIKGGYHDFQDIITMFKKYKIHVIKINEEHLYMIEVLRFSV
jgi:hypothetical protein